ncbi:MAG: hypothetical protein JEY91_10735 [Spirochaetaceae bacterium]|nr:hypothetical protein [Spirochaetaceae bacterium]
MILKRSVIFLLLCFVTFNPLMGQSVEEEQTDLEEVVEEEIIKRTEKLEPVLPQQNPSIIFVEGEDAVSTNFNREPILNYSCSGFRTLQLNQINDLHGEATYNADYVFYAEQDGVYELWYGGTPPGNRDEILTSYASPFRFTLDGIYSTDVYREDIHVAEEYSPSYYWNYVSDVTLEAGEHRMKFEVLLRRSLDNKYFFYMDNFFLVKKENDQRVVTGEIPEVFPEDMDNRSIDTYFKSFEEYEVLIRDNPEKVENYIALANIYSLAGDYLNALKYLRRAALLEPDDPDIMLLTAKNLIWRGSTVEGLNLYRDLLEIVPERIDLWTEAGKIAGWTGQYQDSIDFFEGGLKVLPDDLSLIANLGITNLWLGEVNRAEKHFEKVLKLAGDDLKQNRALAEIFRINGYPDKAVPLYRRLINIYPEELELYFDLEETYNENDQREKIPEIRKITEETFNPNSEFSKVTGTFYESQRMKEKVIEDYEEQLANDPENLSLRRVLAEIYFWNGFRKKAISEYRNILTNYTYLNLLGTEQEMVPFLELLDRNYALSHFMENISTKITADSKKLNDLLKSYEKSKAELAALKKRNDDTEAKGKIADRTNESAKREAIVELEGKLAVSIYLNESFIEKFNTVSSQFADENETLTSLLNDEKASAETYKLLMEGINWEWNRDEMLSELDEVKGDNVVLANYVLGKIYQFEGKLGQAMSNYSPMITGDFILDRAPFALYQTEVWLGENKKRSELYSQFQPEIDGVADYIYYLNDFLNYLNLEEEDPFSYLAGDPLESVKTISETLDSIKEESFDINKAITSNISEIHKVLVSHMERGFYNLANETYLLRNELGDFYYNEKMYSKSINQYKQVLAIDPWNLSAKFKLAQVYHFNGDWSNALDIYGEIYEEDPQYNNVASFYNELTRQFADSFNFKARNFSDATSLDFDVHGDYNINFSRNFGLSVDYNVEHRRVYRAYDGVEPTDATSFLLNNVNLRLPLALSRLRITPEGGLYFKTDLINGDGRDESDVPLLDKNLTIIGLFGEHSFYFKGGADLLLSLDSMNLLTGYLFDWQKESFHPGKNPVNYHKAKLELGLNFYKTKIPFIEDTGIYLSGNLKFLSDGNIHWYTSAVVSNSIQILRDPAMYLNVSLDFSLEDTAKTSPDYWTPEMSLLTGLNLEYLAVFPLAEDKSLEEKLWFNTDFYSNGSDNSKGLAFEVGNRLAYTKKDFTTFLNISGSFTTQLDPAVSGINYWSVLVELGVSVLLPDLLTP